MTFLKVGAILVPIMILTIKNEESLNLGQTVLTQVKELCFGDR